MTAKSDALQDDSDVYTLTDSSAFLEFLSADEKTRETFLSDELEEGKFIYIPVLHHKYLHPRNIRTLGIIRPYNCSCRSGCIPYR